MTPDELASCLDAIGWSRRRAAMRLRRAQSTVEDWWHGHRPVPERDATYLRALAEFHRSLPLAGLREEHLPRVRDMVAEHRTLREIAETFGVGQAAADGYLRRHGLRVSPEAIKRALSEGQAKMVQKRWGGG